MRAKKQPLNISGKILTGRNRINIEINIEKNRNTPWIQVKILKVKT